MQRLKALLVTVINTLLAKLKRLAIHVIKHPLGSMWWAVKMYFALMFFSLFVACSFGAFAADNEIGQCAIGTPLAGVGCTTGTRYNEQWKWTLTKTINGSTVTQYFFGSTKLDAQTKACNWAAQVENANSKNNYYCVNGTLKVKPCNLVMVNGVLECKFGAEQGVTLGGTAVIVPATHMCPPENEIFAAFTTLYQPNAITNLCKKDFDEPNTCFKDPKYSIANQYHFAPQDAGKGSVCVDSDGGQLCPWKELTGSNGVFSPDTSSTTPCTNEPPSDPMPPPPEPPECTFTVSGMKVCKEDPNTKCTANSSNAMSCPPSCGYMNNVFVCFENPSVEPEEPEEPEEPDIPRPPADDNIENPDKPIADMLKKDFKDVQRGVETRLDGFAADMANLLKAEKAGNDQLVKNTAQGNKLLNSINQNTANTVDELKKLNEGTVAGAIEKPEFGDKNDWATRNFGTVLKGKVTELSNLPIIKSATSFFNVTFAGSCPVYNVSVWVFEIQIDQFCTAEMQAIFPYIKAVVLLIAALVAFRVAFL